MSSEEIWVPQNSLDMLRETGGAKHFFKREEEAVRRIRSRKFCGAAGCEAGASAIKAHGIQRAVYLESIARDQHVYSTLAKGAAHVRQGKEVRPQLLSCAEASTFYGFCPDHDRDLFLHIEAGEEPEDCEAFFLHAFRTLVAQIWFDGAAFESWRSHHGTDGLRRMAPLHNWGGWIANRLDELAAVFHSHRLLKMHFDEVLRSKSWSEYSVVTFPIKKAPPVLCYLAQLPNFTFAGDRQSLDSHAHPAAPLVFLHLHPVSGNDQYSGLLSMGWLNRSREYAEPFVHSFEALDQSERLDALLRLLFHQHGAIAIGPDWWESLGDETQNGLLESWRLQQAGKPRESHAAVSAHDTHLGISDWEIGDSTWVSA